MPKANNIGKISIVGHRIDWKIRRFSEWPNVNEETVIYSPLFRFAGGDRYFSAYLTLEEDSVILSGMSITRCTRDRHDFHYITFGIVEDFNEECILVTSRDAHGGMAADFKLKCKKKQNTKFGGNLHLFSCWNAVGSMTDELSDDLFAVLQMKDGNTTFKDVATQTNMKSVAVRKKDKKATCKKAATQGYMKNAACGINDEKARCKNVATQEDMKSVTDVGNLCQNFKNLLLNGQDHDLILKVNNKEFRAHQNILRVRSPVLDSMLSHDMIEKKGGIIDIPDCDPEAFEQFLLYLYSGEVERLDEGIMLALYNIADKYDMGHLKKQCREFIKNSLTSINFTDVIEFALDHSDAALLASAKDYFLQNANVILRTVKWQSFAARNVAQANEFYIKPFHSLKTKKM